MNYVVLWSDIAKLDLINIYLFIEKDSKANADKIYEELRERAFSLENMPLTDFLDVR